MNKYLFIGGTHDGERLRVNQSPVDLPKKKPTPVSFDYGISEAEAFETEVYSTQVFAGNSCTYVLYALQGMSADDVVDALIEGYRAAPKLCTATEWDRDHA